MTRISRHLNYTGRKTLFTRHVQFAIEQDNRGRAFVNVVLDLKDLRLERDATVFVEAIRHTAFCRWDFGVVGTPRQRPGELPPEMGNGDGVRFRIKIVEPVASKKGKPPRLLAMGDSFFARLPNPTKGKSLLPVDWGDFRDEVWRLEIDEQGGPLLRICRHLVNDYEALVRSSEFVTLAMPSLFRQLLTHIVVIQGTDAADGEPKWAADWVRLAGQWNGQGDPPDPKSDPDKADQWIDSAVESFARRVKVAATFSTWWQGAPGGQS